MKIYKSTFWIKRQLRCMLEVHLDDGEDEDDVSIAVGCDADAVNIEWKETELWEPVIGSSCTLRLISSGDRTLTSLYSVEPQRVKLLLKINGVLAWQGVIDPELYEEPYDTYNDYEVTLNFSDFGVLDRMPFDGYPAGQIVSVRNIVEKAVKAIGVFDTVAFTNLYTLATDTSSADALQDIYVCTDNFFDEDGEPLTWSEVLSGVLQPLGLRIAQTGDGKITIFDLTTQRLQTPTDIQWDGTGHTLGVGKVYNNINIRFSPYGESSALTAAVEPDQLSGNQLGEILYYSIDDDDTQTYATHSIIYGRVFSGKYPRLLDTTRGTYYSMFKLYGGEDGQGIAGKIWGSNLPSEQSAAFGIVPKVHPESGMTNITPLFDAGSVYINPFASPTKNVDGTMFAKVGNSLCVKLRLLFDNRANPFEDGDGHNNKSAYDEQKAKWNRVYVPVKIYIEGPDGEKYHWHNINLFTTRNTPDLYYRLSKKAPLYGSWHSGEGEWGDCWLTYYNWSDNHTTTGCNGWATNRQSIWDLASPPDFWQKRGDGEYIDMPPIAGTLHVIIGSGIGIQQHRPAVALPEETDIAKWLKPKWLLYGEVNVDLCDNYGQSMESEDLVYTAQLLDKARDPLNIDTICGSGIGALPTARGLLLDDAYKPLTKLYRHNICGTPEEILVASIASQYDSRHTVLSGEVFVPSGPLRISDIYAEEANAGKLFAMLSCRYNVRDVSAECSFVELSEQKYTPLQ